MNKREREVVVKVTAECVSCKTRKDIGPGEVPAGEMPTCPKCYSPMVAVSASAKSGRKR